MNIIKLKRMAIILSGVVVAIGVYGIKKNVNEATISTMAVPVTNKVIVIDAGHRTEKMEELLAVMESVKLILIYQLH